MLLKINTLSNIKNNTSFQLKFWIEFKRNKHSFSIKIPEIEKRNPTKQFSSDSGPMAGF
jgi:hypothetical protein